MITLGEQIKLVRISRNLSQNKLSKLSGVSRSYLIEVEENKYNMTIEMICKISKALDCTPNDLIPFHYYR